MSQTKFIINKKPIIKGIGNFVVTFKNVVCKEPKNLAGISHLCEHLICEPIKEIEEEMLSKGIKFNASTDSQDVLVFIEGLDENLDIYKKVLLEKLLNKIPNKNIFERERNVVLAEYDMVMSDQNTNFTYNIYRKYFNETSCLGYRANLENLTYEKFLDFYKENFLKAHYVFNISNSKFSLSKEEISKYFTNKNVLNKLPALKFGIYDTFKVERDIEYSNEIIKLMKPVSQQFWEENKNKFKTLIYLDIFASYLSSGLNSPLMKEIREALGNVYCTFASFEKTFKGDSLFSIETQTHIDNKDVVAKKMAEVFEYHLNNLNEKRFNIIKENLISSTKEFFYKKTPKFWIIKYLHNKSFKYQEYILKEDFNFEEFKEVIERFKIIPITWEYANSIKN